MHLQSLQNYRIYALETERDHPKTSKSYSSVTISEDKILCTVHATTQTLTIHSNMKGFEIFGQIVGPPSHQIQETCVLKNSRILFLDQTGTTHTPKMYIDLYANCIIPTLWIGRRTTETHQSHSQDERCRFFGQAVAPSKHIKFIGIHYRFEEVAFLTQLLWTCTEFNWLFCDWVVPQSAQKDLLASVGV